MNWDARHCLSILKNAIELPKQILIHSMKWKFWLFWRHGMEVAILGFAKPKAPSDVNLVVWLHHLAFDWCTNATSSRTSPILRTAHEKSFTSLFANCRFRQSLSFSHPSSVLHRIANAIHLRIDVASGCGAQFPARRSGCCNGVQLCRLGISLSNAHFATNPISDRQWINRLCNTGKLVNS